MPSRAGGPRWSPWLLYGLLALLAWHGVGVCLDFAAGVRFPYQLDYGEGIVWQQAALIPGPRMYSASRELPFIVFHYPPVYHLLTRAVGLVTPDLLVAGRLVSGAAALAVGGLVAALVVTAAGGRRREMYAVAAVAGLVALTLHAVRTWGLVMRVDLVAVALGLAGVLVAARADGRLLGTAAGLLLCTGAVFAKQTQLSAGIAVFVVAVLRHPRVGLGAGAIALAAGIMALLAMQYATAGGFLVNILGNNLNRMSWWAGQRVMLGEIGSAPCMVLIVLSAMLLVGRWRGGGLMLAVRHGDRATAARGMVLLHLVVATLMLPMIFKSGSSFNYLLDWLTVGCVVLGVAMAVLLREGHRLFGLVAAVLVAWTAVQPFRAVPDRFPDADMAQRAALVRRVAEAGGPVASEDMGYLMRAGKPVVFEPSIVTELASVGRWDEGALVAMIRRRGFAFMITVDPADENLDLRTPAVARAMREAYPRVKQAAPDLWVRLPP